MKNTLTSLLIGFLLEKLTCPVLFVFGALGANRIASFSVEEGQTRPT